MVFKHGQNFTKGKIMHYKSPDNSVHFLDDDSFAYLLPTGSVPISDAEAATIRAAIQAAAQAARTYAEKRAAEYPPIGDQLDALWKGGDAQTEMLAKVMAVKTKYPKPADSAP
jgi:hypothetical protein